MSKDTSTRRESEFRPISTPMNGNNLKMLKLLSLFFISFMAIAPIVLSNSPTTAILQSEDSVGFLPSQSLYHYTLPGSSSIQIATGTVQGYNGFAYVIDDEDVLYFVDVFNGATLTIVLPTGDQSLGSDIVGYDVDGDGDSEFLIRNYVNSQFYILVADIDDSNVAQYPIPFNYPAAVGFGDFNGDVHPDVLIKNINNNNDFMTLDLFGNDTIGSFLVDYCYAGQIVGNFASYTEDSIALVSRYSLQQRNLTLVAADGVQIDSIILTPSIQDLVTFHYSDGLDEIATIESDGDIVVYSGPALGVTYTNNVELLSSSYRTIQSGDFNLDSQEDLVVISRTQEKAYFMDGYAGFPIRETTGIYMPSYKRQGLGLMDSDALDDLAVGTVDGGLGIIRGQDGMFAYTEYLIDVRSVSSSYQIEMIDVNGDTRADVLCRILGDVYLLLSDSTPPGVVQLPIVPRHPTTLDDYVTVEVQVSETSGIERADIFMRISATGSWIQPQDEMYASHQEGFYYAFIANLQAGSYEYYMEFQDTYLNTVSVGDSVLPMSFTVTGDFVWQFDKSDTDYVDSRAHQSDSGYLFGGQRVIYTIERERGVENLTLTQYSSTGTLLDTVTIVDTGEVRQYFEVYTAMLDGDIVSDIIVLDKTPSYLYYHVYHGNTLSLIGEGICPYPYKSFNYLGIIDDDKDGNDELLLVSDTTPLSLIKMDSDTSWSEVELSGTAIPRGYSVIHDPDTGDGYIAVLRGDLAIDIYRAEDLSFIRSLDIELSAYSDQVAIALTSRYNSFLAQEEFVAAVNYWHGTDPTGRIFIFDSTTTNVNSTPYYAVPHEGITYAFAYDTVGSASDELFILLNSGELRMTETAASLTTLWSTFVTSATPLSATVADFDGDDSSEFLLFTDQDELVTSVSFYGEVEWTVKVGEVRNPLLIGNIDLVPGEEIAAYPFASINSMILGAIRNLDSTYLLDVSMEYSSTNLIQGDTLVVNATVLNIYGDLVDDATVYMNANYMTPEGLGSNTYGFYYAGPWSKYSTTADVTWPIGTVDLSFEVDNGFYHAFRVFFADALTVSSALHVDLEVPDIVQQGANMSIRAIVFDNLGGVVEGTTVTVSIDGIVYPTVVTGQRHILMIPEVQFEAGEHLVLGRAVHPFAVGEGQITRAFTVKVLTEDLLILTDFPVSAQQDDLIGAWFNVTDAYGHAITGADVSLKSGARVFGMAESPTEPGCYWFAHNMSLSLGVQIFDVNVARSNINGPPATTIGVEVYGNLEPSVFYDTRVEGGSMFPIHVFVKDRYGPVTIGTSVTVEINGTRYTEIDVTDNPDYFLDVPADFLVGKNNFTVYVNATYATPWIGVFTIRAYADASSSASIVSTQGWTVKQGGETTLELTLEDWVGRPVSGARVSFYVKALAYTLHEVSPGFYAANVSTIGWAPGMYGYTVSVNHEDIQTGDPIEGDLTILGILHIDVTCNPEQPTQGGSLLVSVFIADDYGNPIPDLEVYVSAMDLPTLMAEETELIGLYTVFIEHLPRTQGYGTKNISIEVAGQFIEPSAMSGTFYLSVANPEIGLIDTQTAVSFTAISFVVSLFGMFLYFRMAPSLRRTGPGKEELQKSVKRMDRLYLVIVLASAVGFVASMRLSAIGDFGGALILTVTLLGASVLLYGLWLYRDAVSAVMVTGALNKKRMVAGLWHLFFVPIVIVMILTYGAEIDWFKAYMIDPAIDIGGLSIPTIMTTIFVAYLSSILVVVVNLYREVKNGLRKLRRMRDADTPVAVIEDEKEAMVNRFSSSVRIKFLMFLVVVGAAAVTTMDFLQSYELGIIVLLPVAFLVVIPFISSRIVQALNRASKVKIKKTGVPTGEESTTSVSEETA